MKITKILLFALVIISSFISCKKELDVKNTNQPVPESALQEAGMIAFAQGGIYRNGFINLKHEDGVYGYFWSGAIGFHEMMGDAIGIEAANAFSNQLGVANSVTLDNGEVVINPNSPKLQYDLIRSINQNANQGQNPLFYEWAYMYSMISSCNFILENIEKVTFAIEGPTKIATLKTWAYWWKGFAYARIGSIYYAGLINNASKTTNSNYVTKEAIIAESNKNLDLCATAMDLATNASVFAATQALLLPSFTQVGKGGALTIAEWKRNINTLKARNIVVNKKVSDMTSGDWGTVLSLTIAGVLPTDKVFTGRSNTAGDFLSPASGTVASKVQSAQPGDGTYKLSERLVQDFKPGDRRLANNIAQGTTWIGNSDRGNIFNTRFRLINKGLGMAGVKVYTNTDAGAEEIFLASSYEENALMRAEALINTGSIDAGLAFVDAVRTFQGAGLAAVSGSGLLLAQAREELRRERRCALPFIGLSFYDARRLGIIDPGVGRTGAVVISKIGVVNTNAKIEYGFLDYWDVPDNELASNPPATGSAPTKNPK